MYNEVHIINYEYPSSEVHLEIKYQANVFLYDNYFEEKNDKVQEKNHNELRKFLSGPIQN